MRGAEGRSRLGALLAGAVRPPGATLGLPRPFDPIDLLESLPPGTPCFSWEPLEGERIFALAPAAVVRTRGTSTVVETREGRHEVGADPFEALEAAEGALAPLGRARGAAVFLALAYEAGRFVEPGPYACLAPGPFPDLALLVADTFLVSGDSTPRIYAPDRDAARGLLDRLAHAPPPPAGPSRGLATGLSALLAEQVYAPRVARIQRAIARGEIYQANLTYPIRFRFRGHPAALFRSLRRAALPPMGAYLDLGPLQVLSASPERFLRRRGRGVETFPIKGTRPRGASAVRDRALRRALAENPKERAEHLMIVDLLRNDLGRVARTGSVRVDPLLEVRSFETVHHLESRVSAELRGGTSTRSLLEALFPGGSITGAPKIRSVQILASIEREPRGIYTGALGIADFARSRLDLSVAIRTATVAGGRGVYPVGGGIVADSDPAMEYRETIQKGEVLFRALGIRPRRET